MAAGRFETRDAARMNVLTMRPAILNPLFTETGALKGVGSALVRQLARLKLTRVIDLLFHLPIMAIERVQVERIDESLVGRPIVVTLTWVRSWISRYGTPSRSSGTTRQRSINASNSAGVHRSRNSARICGSVSRLSNALHKVSSGDTGTGSGWSDLRFIVY